MKLGQLFKAPPQPKALPGTAEERQRLETIGYFPSIVRALANEPPMSSEDIYNRLKNGGGDPWRTLAWKKFVFDAIELLSTLGMLSRNENGDYFRPTESSSDAGSSTSSESKKAVS